MLFVAPTVLPQTLPEGDLSAGTLLFISLGSSYHCEFKIITFVLLHWAGGYLFLIKRVILCVNIDPPTEQGLVHKPPALAYWQAES